uniref:PiggyBac transposable element-derived protein domain-containing protein n=1 Tax=Phytophthora ramorum TaxID=164328 RepID=H3GUK0_PHYRM
MTEEGSVHVEQEAKEKGVEVVVDSPPVADLAEEKEAETVVDRPPVTDATETASSIGNQRKRRRAIFEDVSASGESSSDEDVAASELLPMQPQCVVDGDTNLMDAAAYAYIYLDSDEDISVEEDQESCDDDGGSDWDIGELTNDDLEDDGGEDLPESACSSIAHNKTAISMMRTHGWEYEKFGPDPTYEDLYEGPYGPSNSVMAVGDDPLALLFYFMPPKLLPPKRARAIRSQQRRAGQELEELGDIRSRLARVPDIEPWEVLRVMSLLIVRMLIPMRKGIAAHCFDEATLPSRSHYNPTRQFNKDKPHKWGTKVFVATCAETAYCLRPELVRDYHRWMGGVDVHDQLQMQRYSVQLSYKTRKYYKTFFLGLFDMALVNAFIVFRHHKKLNDNRPQGKKRSPKRYAFFEVLLEQLLEVDSAEPYKTIERATTARERTAASPARAAAPPDPAPERTTEMGGHRLDENPDTVDNEQGLQKRQRSCKVCALFKTKPRKYTKYFCPECSTENRRYVSVGG